MAKLKLNLAKRPFINTRPLNLTLAIIAVALAGLTFRNVYRLFDSLATRRVLSAEIVIDEAARAEAKAETTRLNATISKSEGLRIRTVSAAIKDVIQKRQLSWSRLLDHLAAVVPADVRIMAIDPAPAENRIGLVLRCVAKDHGAKRDFYDALNHPPFSHGDIMSQAVDPTGKIAFVVNCDYDPAAPAVAVPVEKGEGEEEGNDESESIRGADAGAVVTPAATDGRRTAIPAGTTPTSTQSILAGSDQ